VLLPSTTACLPVDVDRDSGRTRYAKDEKQADKRECQFIDQFPFTRIIVISFARARAPINSDERTSSKFDLRLPRLRLKPTPRIQRRLKLEESDPYGFFAKPRNVNSGSRILAFPNQFVQVRFVEISNQRESELATFTRSEASWLLEFVPTPRANGWTNAIDQEFEESGSQSTVLSPSFTKAKLTMNCSSPSECNGNV